ncbi:hypothetical protein G647_06097 [Cladophialophora carrionii CBS 160.54]|uniref:Heterokaryon incompatibility domain-containing protein n=1 Tax=Cladophialophora carrionii CBS 160.54 TaxID=1279043 RepID=V9D7S4_9EURO|nr:uncharacterized protein G647_06097 [Cladophialophora carrionii CBS 160.54]ETI22027.1 hypothetical protein G647_06097 [Cladophialophora carrionii CBS 160.54]
MTETFRDLYGIDWDTENTLSSRDINCAHPSLKDLSASAAAAATAAYIQSWLYFGLLEAICGRAISVSYLTRPDTDGQAWMYSRHLGLLLATWRKELDAIEHEAREATLHEARDCATLASTILHEILRESTKSDFSELRTSLLSVEPCLSALHEAIVAFVERELRMEVRSFGSFEAGPFEVSRPYSESLVAKGWCRFVVASAEVAMSPSLLRSVAAADFQESTKGHEHCTAEQCRRNHVELSTYKPLHTAPNCQCAFLKPSIKSVRAILNVRKIPVVQLSQNGRNLELGAVDLYDPSADYIAFSHVWADGLGSSTEAGLPRCQILRLDHLAGLRLSFGRWFWIDGLLVPSQEPYRGKAIEMMKETYQNATGVIVLDSSLRSLSVSASTLELGWAVFASGWFGRLWTYEEGFLPPWVDMELQDGLLDLYVLIQRLYKSYFDRSGSPFPNVFLRDLLAVLQKARPLDRTARARFDSRPKVRRIVDIFNAFTRRRTSRADDQLLIMGLLLDVDVRGLMKKEGADRWTHFYLGLGEIPWTVVFDRRPKIEKYPFRWAPASWISPGRDVWLHYDDALGTISDRGLKVRLSVLSLEQARCTDMSALFLEVDELRYELSRSSPSPSSTLDKFNIVFVRYFAHESPQESLRKNNSLLLEVGLGLLSQESDDHPLQYDFSPGWDIHLMTEQRDDNTAPVETVQAEWMERDFCFT